MNPNEGNESIDPSSPHRTSSPLRASTPLRESPSLCENDYLFTVLTSEGLGHIVDLLRTEKIDLSILMEMEKSEFIEIGINAFGDRHKLFKILKNLKEKRLCTKLSKGPRQIDRISS